MSLRCAVYAEESFGPLVTVVAVDGPTQPWRSQTTPTTV